MNNWKKSRIDKLGGEEAFIKAQRELASRPRPANKGKGYFKWLKENDPDRLREIIAKRNAKNNPPRTSASKEEL